MKDRARPFARKHKRYWLTVTGGMFLIMSINIGLGLAVMRCDTEPPPPADYRAVPPVILPADAAVDAAPAADAAPAPLLPDQIER